MVLDVLALAVEGIVGEPRGLGLGAVETATDDTAQGSRTGLLGGAKSETEHCCGGRRELRLVEGRKKAKLDRGQVKRCRWIGELGIPLAVP